MRWMLLLVGLLVAVPGLSMANGMERDKVGEKSTVQKEAHHGSQPQHFRNKQNWEEKMKENDTLLLSWVNTYSPEKKQEWTKVIAEGKDLRAKWHSPEYAKQREQWKMKKMAQMESLKKSFEQGKITKEEFYSKLHGAGNMEFWITYHELKMAVEAKDQQKAKKLMDQMLVQYKMHNEKIKSMMKMKTNQ